MRLPEVLVRILLEKVVSDVSDASSLSDTTAVLLVCVLGVVNVNSSEMVADFRFCT